MVFKFYSSSMDSSAHGHWTNGIQIKRSRQLGSLLTWWNWREVSVYLLIFSICFADLICKLKRTNTYIQSFILPIWWAMDLGGHRIWRDCLAASIIRLSAYPLPHASHISVAHIVEIGHSAVWIDSFFQVVVGASSPWSSSFTGWYNAAVVFRSPIGADRHRSAPIGTVSSVGLYWFSYFTFFLFKTACF